MFFVSDEDSGLERILSSEDAETTRKKNYRKELKKPKRFVISGFQYNGKVNREFMKNLEKYAEVNDAELIFPAMRGKHIDEDMIPEELEDYEISTRNRPLNRKIKVQKFDIRPNQIDPLTGLDRFVQDETSAVIAAPKIAQRSVANSKHKLPKILMTTGAVTHPNYAPRHRINHIAREDHTYGALVVETVNSVQYHFRHLNALKNGTFYDLGERFSKGRDPVRERPRAMVLGDWHVGDTDPVVREETFRMLDMYQPERVFLHDIFNGHSINHWNRGKHVDLYKNRHRLSLPEEIEMVAHELEEFTKRAPRTKFYVVASNHDDRLLRYLNEGEFMNETHPYNLKESLELMRDILPKNPENGEKERNPLEVGVRKYASKLKNVHFLEEDADFKIGGWQLANHGHLGANGGRGTKRSIERANGKSITMHSHVPEIFRNMYKGGTSTYLDLDYNKGYSGWMNTHVMLHPNDRPQLVNIIEGQHRRDYPE